LLLAISIVVISDSSAGVRISQIWGIRPGTVHPGVHVVTPLAAAKTQKKRTAWRP
jgi:hypothetical protein